MTMNKELWTEVDRYLAETIIQPDAAVSAALAASVAAGLPEIAVSPNLGKLLHLLARMMDAQRILEIGTLGGYSTIWLARALPPDGQVVSLEIDPNHVAVARENVDRAGVADRVEIILGPAMESLATLHRAGRGPFDLFFIDADKPNIPDYFQWSLRLSRPGSVIIVDNVVRDGAVIDSDSKDESVQGVRRFNEMVATERRVSATTLQTVGSKGYDGFTLMVVN
jgi:predicted O-methyltransferase YrrM